LSARSISTLNDHYDVVVIGAGVSGIGMAYHLKHSCSKHSFAIVDSKAAPGGTWVTHKYPGIRSDSDLMTYGYSFEPWNKRNMIATGEEIISYLNRVISKYNLSENIHYNHKVLGCNYDSTSKKWHLEIEVPISLESKISKKLSLTSNFVMMCPGYYDHEKPFIPSWPGMKDFQGKIVHPMTWEQDTKDTDFSDKQVVLIGSGATAATIIPALINQSEKCKSITMLQRTPTYMSPGIPFEKIADILRKFMIPEKFIHRIMRWYIVKQTAWFIKLCQRNPEKAKSMLMDITKKMVKNDELVEKHFTPPYRPWQQRLCLIPDGDLFRAIRKGQATIKTDQIEKYQSNGIQLKSGEFLSADIVIAATGFNLAMMGNIPITVDGQPVQWGDTITWRGMMFTDVPNLASIFGYFRYSWTLRVDVVGEFVCRLLQHMREEKIQEVSVQLRPEEKKSMAVYSWIDEKDFNPGYLTRNKLAMPKRGAIDEWSHSQDYLKDQKEFPRINLKDSVFHYRK
jgi:cation diffusion facilitator CzcD-associated flavoprotein CzcO